MLPRNEECEDSLLCCVSLGCWNVAGWVKEKELICELWGRSRLAAASSFDMAAVLRAMPTGVDAAGAAEAEMPTEMWVQGVVKSRAAQNAPCGLAQKRLLVEDCIHPRAVRCRIAAPAEDDAREVVEG